LLLALIASLARQHLAKRKQVLMSRSEIYA
jgi:hypothetical protein